jgi:hypothetical protein
MCHEFACMDFPVTAYPEICVSSRVLGANGVPQWRSVWKRFHLMKVSDSRDYNPVRNLHEANRF